MGHFNVSLFNKLKYIIFNLFKNNEAVDLTIVEYSLYNAKIWYIVIFLYMNKSDDDKYALRCYLKQCLSNIFHSLIECNY